MTTTTTPSQRALAVWLPMLMRNSGRYRLAARRLTFTLKTKCVRFLVVCLHDKVRTYVSLRPRLFAARVRRHVLASTTFHLVAKSVP